MIPRVGDMIRMLPSQAEDRALVHHQDDGFDLFELGEILEEPRHILSRPHGFVEEPEMQARMYAPRSPERQPRRVAPDGLDLTQQANDLEKPSDLQIGVKKSAPLGKHTPTATSEDYIVSGLLYGEQTWLKGSQSEKKTEPCIEEWKLK
ncbi:hypothetical protein NPX13_g7725 [Xylaria arbuscula]|uniref:Uncharacterized protein n=1 Tax=Xylaria arbuscula TaxID=114810 RepID=A0A9W8NA50_9PEZI|nr:hypothetical protein NPX13_g7725 [Xylaria arbuscula]